MSVEREDAIQALPAEQDRVWMQKALHEASKAEVANEVPIGAIVVLDGQIIGRGYNTPIATHDPTAHAEICALRQAAQQMHNYRLIGTTLYSTLEPCVMCMGAMIYARIKRLVFGCFDPKAGAAGSLYNLPVDARLNHRLEVSSGICEDDCRVLLQRFFQKKRHG